MMKLSQLKVRPRGDHPPRLSLIHVVEDEAEAGEGEVQVVLDPSPPAGDLGRFLLDLAGAIVRKRATEYHRAALRLAFDLYKLSFGEPFDESTFIDFVVNEIVDFAAGAHPSPFEKESYVTRWYRKRAGDRDAACDEERRSWAESVAVAVTEELVAAGANFPDTHGAGAEPDFYRAAVRFLRTREVADRERMKKIAKTVEHGSPSRDATAATPWALGAAFSTDALPWFVRRWAAIARERADDWTVDDLHGNSEAADIGGRCLRWLAQIVATVATARDDAAEVDSGAERESD